MTESCFFQTPCKQFMGVIVKKIFILHSFCTYLGFFIRLRHNSNDIFFFYTQCKHFLHVLVRKIYISFFFSSSSPQCKRTFFFFLPPRVIFDKCFGKKTEDTRFSVECAFFFDFCVQNSTSACF